MVRQADLGELVDASAVVFHGVVSRVEDSPASRTGRFVTIDRLRRLGVGHWTGDLAGCFHFKCLAGVGALSRR